LTDINVNVAEKAGLLKGNYSDLKTIDAIQISSAIEIGSDAFLTNDKRLKKIKEIKVMVLEDYL
jgi:predicted nucleic acid-binding protein